MEAVKIHPPEGYEVCPTSTQTEIRFRPISKSKPKCEDFGALRGYYIEQDSDISRFEDTGACLDDRNIWPTEEEAEACLALSQLCQWRDKYNGDWKPDYTGGDYKWSISVSSDEIVTSSHPYVSHVLIFKTSMIRNKFLEDFRPLIETAKPLL